MRKTYVFIATLATLLATTSAQAQIQTVSDSELSTINGQFAEVGIIHYSRHLIDEAKYDVTHTASLFKADFHSAHQSASDFSSQLASDLKSDASEFIQDSTAFAQNSPALIVKHSSAAAQRVSNAAVQRGSAIAHRGINTVKMIINHY